MVCIRDESYLIVGLDGRPVAQQRVDNLQVAVAAGEVQGGPAGLSGSDIKGGSRQQDSMYRRGGAWAICQSNE